MSSRLSRPTLYSLATLIGLAVLPLGLLLVGAGALVFARKVGLGAVVWGTVACTLIWWGLR